MDNSCFDSTFTVHDSPRLSREKGFSLIELLIVISIIGVLAAIAMPNLLKMMPGMRVNTATRQLMSKMLLLKMKAISENRSYRISFSGGGTQYTVQQDVDRDQNWELSDPIIETLELPNGIMFGTNATIKPGGGAITCSDDGICLSDNKASFSETGTVTSGAIYIIVRDDKGTTRTDRMSAINTNSTGRVRAWRYTGVGSDPWTNL